MRLRDAEGNPLEADAHRERPGHVAWVATRWSNGNDASNHPGAVFVTEHEYLYPVLGCEG